MSTQTPDARTDVAHTKKYTITSCFHADHGVDEALRQWAIESIAPTAGFFLSTLTIPADHAPLASNLYGPAEGDAPVKGVVSVRDKADAWRQDTPFVDLPPRPTRRLTVIGLAKDDGEVTLWTCYGGEAALQLPSDPAFANDPKGRAKAEVFWAQHALSVAAKK